MAKNTGVIYLDGSVVAGRISAFQPSAMDLLDCKEKESKVSCDKLVVKEIILDGVDIKSFFLNKKTIRSIIDLYEVLSQKIEEKDNICDIIEMKLKLEAIIESQ